MPLLMSKELASNYANYYTNDDDLPTWRRLGALDKCANIVHLCSTLDHDQILEVGCGEGAILQRLSELQFGTKYAGLEISPSAVQRVLEKGLQNVEIRLFGGYELSFPDRRFDLAILSHVLEHVEYPRKLIYEAARVAKNVFIEVPLEDNLKLSRDFVFDRVGHINFYNVKTIRRLVQSCGMRILREHLSHSSRQSYAYRKGKWRGAISYFVKEASLRAWPRLAANLFTYHYSVVYSLGSTSRDGEPCASVG
jgi:SAM-dependent methyltransferase